MADVPTQLAEALQDRCVLERELGRGGTATVFLARDVNHKRPVALKGLHPQRATSLAAQGGLRARLSSPPALC